MYSVDKSNFIEFLENFPNQISTCFENLHNLEMNLDTSRIQNIIFSGMGGSAIAGDLVAEYLFDQLPVPMNVLRGYEIPASCSENTLVIASSYSGDTEETLSAVSRATETGAQIIGITSGGQLTRMCNEKGWPLISMPKGFPPRQAFGYSFFSILFVMRSLGFAKVDDADLNETVNLVKAMVERNHYQKATGKILSQEVARRIHGKIPVIYSTAPYLRSLSRRWQNQFHENGKSIAFSNVLPELNHNEIVGWEMEHPALKDFIIIVIEDPEINKRNQARLNLTKEIIKDRGIEVLEIYSQGQSRLQRLISLVAMGDWISYYLAIDYKKDPMEILNIDFLKNELKKIN